MRNNPLMHCSNESIRIEVIGLEQSNQRWIAVKDSSFKLEVFKCLVDINETASKRLVLNFLK